MSWFRLARRANAAAETAADLRLTEVISGQVQLAQAQQGAQDRHDRVQRRVADVHQQLTLCDMQLTRLRQEEVELDRQVKYLVNKFKLATQQERTADAATARQQGAGAAARLQAKRDEIAKVEAFHAQLLQAVQVADGAAATADQQLQDSQLEAERLQHLRVQTALATATTDALRDLTNPQGDGTTATMAQARDRVEGDFAAAMGMSQVIQTSAGAQQINLQAEMHRAAGENLFDQAVNAS